MELKQKEFKRIKLETRELEKLQENIFEKLREVTLLLEELNQRIVKLENP